MTRQNSYVICIRNDGYPASLELRKVYPVRSDDRSEAHGFLRIADESGEDYIYPAEYFAPIQLPEAAERAFAAAGEAM